MIPAPAAQAERGDEVLVDDETHLRSCREVAGYALQAPDGELGHVEDFLFDDLDWAVRYIVVDTRNWWFGKKVVIPPEWVDSIDWSERSLRVDVSRDAVQGAPAYAATEHVNRQWEADYYAHHQRPPYWTSRVPALFGIRRRRRTRTNSRSTRSDDLPPPWRSESFLKGGIRLPEQPSLEQIECVSLGR